MERTEGVVRKGGADGSHEKVRFEVEVSRSAD
jgi:hypothetical protein